MAPNPTDDTIAQLEHDWPSWFIWIVPRMVGYDVWCARRRDDPTVVLNADTPEHLAEALEDQVSDPIDHGWISGTCGGGAKSAEHTSELHSRPYIPCPPLVVKKKNNQKTDPPPCRPSPGVSRVQ